MKREVRVENTPERTLALVEEVKLRYESLRAAEAVKDEATDVVKARKADLEKTELVLRQGYEFREVDCEERLDTTENRVEIVRLDTGTVIDTRPAGPDDYDRKLPLDDDPPPSSDEPIDAEVDGEAPSEAPEEES